MYKCSSGLDSALSGEMKDGGPKSFSSSTCMNEDGGPKSLFSIPNGKMDVLITYHL